MHDENKDNLGDSESQLIQNSNEKYYKRLFICGLIAILVVAGVGIGVYYALKTSDEEGNDPSCNTCINQTSHLGLYCSDSKLGSYENFSISTDSEPCAYVGKKILLKGGNAVDSIIAVLLCMGVTIPESMGLGGGSLIMIYNGTTGESTAIDAREFAPFKADADIYNRTGFHNSRDGPLAIAVPGELAGYWYMYSNHRSGAIQWEQLFESAIDLCETGFNVSQHLNDALQSKRDFILKDQHLKAVYVNPNTNSIYKTGETMIQRVLGQTLTNISQSDDPKEYFYKTLSKIIVEDIKNSSITEFQPVISVEDFEKYEVKVQTPVIMKNLFKNITLHTIPLPGSGNVLSFILKVMQRHEDLYPSAADSVHNSTLFYHRLIETFKFAFSRRMHLQDFCNSSSDCTQALENLDSDSFINEVLSRITDDQTHEPEYYDPQSFLHSDHGTAHVSVVDSDGNAVSVTTTVNLYFGSKVMSGSTGILLNDEMDDFSTGETNDFGIPPSPTNRIEPYKRPLSSMVPSVFTDDSGLRLVIGGSGGPKITTAVASVAIRNLWFGEDIKTAIDGPRLHHQLYPNEIVYEKCFPSDVLSGLKERGHSLERLSDGDRGAIIMAISKKGGILSANSDYRKGGTVEGQ